MIILPGPRRGGKLNALPPLVIRLAFLVEYVTDAINRNYHVCKREATGVVLLFPLIGLLNTTSFLLPLDRTSMHADYDVTDDVAKHAHLRTNLSCSSAFVARLPFLRLPPSFPFQSPPLPLERPPPFPPP